VIRDGQADPSVDALAANLGRVLVSHDYETMPSHFYRFLEAPESPGLILIPQLTPLGLAIDQLHLVWACTDADEFRNRIVYPRKLEQLDRKPHATPEEEALAELVAKLIAAYDAGHYPAPDMPPHEMVRYLMEQRSLRQADLAPVIGSRAQVSDLVNGRRGVSKAQAKKLAQFFHVSVELFI
jgi:HTH-type transcriptional regulator / antitoxin HigA